MRARIGPLGLLVLLLTTPAVPAADAAWTRLALPDAAKGKALHGVFFLDDKRGWVVGADGLCLATADGGASWVVQETKSKALLRCVRFTNAHTGWACGDGDPDAPATKGHIVYLKPIKASTLLHTTDGGKTWQTFWITTNFEIPCVEPSAAPLIQVGVSGGEDHPDGDITRSPDGGKTWKIRRCFRALFGLARLDAKRWVGVGAPVSVGFLPTPTEELYTNKECRAIYTDDGGDTWKPAQGSNGTAILRGLAAGRGRLLLAVGDNGTILRSPDGGTRWEAVPSPTQKDLRAVVWGDRTPVAVGAKGTALVGTDDGAKWVEVATGVTDDLFGIAAAGERLVAVGKNGTALAADLAKLPGARAAAAPSQR